jgi:Ser/Thr protein kinase RdoA (MazF antagonist)
LTADRVIPAALAAGLLTAEDVVRRSVEVRSIGRSHPVFRVSVGGRPAVVLKVFGARRGDTDGELTREAAVMALGGKRPGVAAVLPPPLRWHGPEAVIATAFVDGSTAASLDGLGVGTSAPPLDWLTLVRTVAPPLARLHTDTHQLEDPDLALVASVPWGLRLFDGDASADLWATPQFARILSALAGDPLTVSAVRRARGAWRVRSLIHGDLKHENVLIYNRDGVLTATFVDWEMARMGDPGWDIAALFVRQLLAEAPSTPWWSDTAVSAAAQLLAHYASAAHLPLPPLAQRLVLYSGVWLIMTTLQFVSTLPNPDAAESQVTPMLAAARTTLAEADRLTARVMAAGAQTTV